jgi:hypothetical protein
MAILVSDQALLGPWMATTTARPDTARKHVFTGHLWETRDGYENNAII